jgi:DNA-binding NarL/FixJ family response regulator
MRVIVAEDNFIRELLVRSFRDHGLVVTGQARTTQELLRLVTADPPDIVTVDISMPRCDPNAGPEYGAGLGVAKEIRRRHPRVAILALSQYGEVPWAEEMAALGIAVGYQLKDQVRDMDALVGVMRSVAAGDIRIDKTLVAALFARKRFNDPVENLSRRERDVLRLMAEGLSNAAISERLFICESTVEGHEASIYRTLRLSSPRGDKEGRPRINIRVMAVLAFLRLGTSLPAEEPATSGIPRQRSHRVMSPAGHALSGQVTVHGAPQIP